MENKDVILYYKKKKDQLIVKYGDGNSKKLPINMEDELINNQKNQHLYYNSKKFINDSINLFISASPIMAIDLKLTSSLSSDSLIAASSLIYLMSVTLIGYGFYELNKSAKVFLQMQKEDLYTGTFHLYDDLNKNKEALKNLKENVKSARKLKTDKITINDLHKIKFNDLLKITAHLSSEKSLTKQRDF